MPFDRTDPADLAALKAEVETDPLGFGYAATTSTAALLALLNDPANHVSDPKPTGPDFLTPKNLLAALFPVNVNSQDQFKLQLIFESAASEDSDVSIYRDPLVNEVGGQVGGAVAGIERELSRGEQLFADVNSEGSTERVVISSDDWFAARNS